jgi:hypothetical protein
MSRYTSRYDDELVDQIIYEFITHCGYVDNKSIRGLLRRPAIGAAGLCRQLKTDAATYVRAHINNAPVLRGYTNLTPGQLFCTDSLNYVKRQLELDKPDYEATFATQCNIFAKCLENGWKQELCLANPSFDFSPWFRILMSPFADMELIEKYGQSAAHILNTDQDLLSYLKSVKDDNGNSFEFKRIPNIKI